MAKKECIRCKKMIDLNKDLYVTLGTHQGKKTIEMAYFHFNCWRQHFEEKTKEKAQNIVNDMEKRMMPIAKQMTDKLKRIIGSDGGEVYNLN